MHKTRLDAAIRGRLTRLFGKQFGKYIDDSPTLRADLRRLARLGVRIQVWQNRAGAYCRTDPLNRQNSLIAIGSEASPIMQAIYLAHEAYHVLRGSTPVEPDTRKMSRKRYVSLGLQEETRAFMHQTRVAHELWSSCNHVLPAWQMHLLLVYHVSGYSNMKDHVLVFKESVNHGFYEDDYGKVWDRSRRRLLRSERTSAARTQKNNRKPEESIKGNRTRTKAA